MELIKFNEKENGDFSFTILKKDDIKVNFNVTKISNNIKTLWVSIKDRFLDLQQINDPTANAQLQGITLSKDTIIFEAMLSYGGFYYKSKTTKNNIEHCKKSSSEFDFELVEFFFSIKNKFEPQILDYVSSLVSKDQIEIKWVH